MTTDPRVLDALQALTDQVDALQLQQAAQGTALLTLARHLAARGHADLPQLALELDAMAAAQPGAGWQSVLSQLAEGLRLPSSRPA